MSKWVLSILAAAGIVVPTAAAHAGEACAPSATKLGVSRTIEVDTAAGPRFGGKKKEYDILEDGEVILTFDDGPIRAYTRHVLDALDAHCTKATFFVVGRMAISDPDMVKEYARRGHTVGVHTWSHANLTRVTPLKARHEIELGLSAVQLAMGAPIAPFFRFPYLAEPKSMVFHLQERHIAMFNIDVDSKDYRLHEASEVRHKVMSDLAVARKGIILFHDIQASTARALPALLGDLRAGGFRVVHMIAKDGATTDPRFDAMAQRLMSRRHVATADATTTKKAPWPAVITRDGRETPPPQAPTPAKPAAPETPFSWFTKIFQ